MSIYDQPEAFREESLALYSLIAGLSEAELLGPSRFKGWTIEDIIRHLHMWNWAVMQSLDDPEQFSTSMQEWTEYHKEHDCRDIEREHFGALTGTTLVREWRDYAEQVADRFAAEDPARRVEWAGPPMSVKMSITARLMETWSHAQAIYDLLGQDRQDQDYIRNIAHIGVATYGWTFANRGEAPIGSVPYVRLTAPSGALWEWNKPDTGNCIEGLATEFCQVVAQTRNISDTELQVTGESATRWMDIAQCFAGPPRNPPTPGTRRKDLP